ncbi:hypothetical protein H0H81_003066 [Sphagnurus paluster]|uniref:Uncharacterized protein n=1 Tax=Sphagnurus paluster TaxID=117069 RepID=A0A9P7GQT6_9AGAR|nr:hypothetical protein H0H81_003066 [Sphagnurus paluster]
MSALPQDEPAQDPSSAIDAQQLQQQLQQQAQQQQHQQDLLAQNIQSQPSGNESGRKQLASHVTPVKHDVVKCYPARAASNAASLSPARIQTLMLKNIINMDTAPSVQSFAPPPMYATLQGTPTLSHQQYYDYNGTFTGASTSTFRPNKRPRNLTEEETAAITRNFSRGDFFVGNSAPVRIDPRLPVRLTLGEGDQVHFTVGETLV